MDVLVVNAGSSSLKLRLLNDNDKLVWSGESLEDLPAADAVGHRIVHGGVDFTGPVRIDDDVVARLSALVDLAPLHQPKSLEALAAVTRALPDVPPVACFDTAFHAQMPQAASTYAIPKQWRNRWHLKKYGFHGLSHAYASRRARELGAGPRVVTCHLGAGASLCAVADGRSVDTTMGFTPLDGLVMATRSGQIDPGLVLWLQEHAGTPPSELAATLEHRSGLLGLAGTPDMRELLERDDDEAKVALDVYLHRLRAGIAAMTASLGGVDAVVFTGGVGENAPRVRADACASLGYLGLVVDPAMNEADMSGDSPQTCPDRQIGERVYVVEAREDLEIARQVRAVLTTSSG
ncbi:MAG TPA: acetate/propionate family kinase [Gaiellaceae bacterium]|nr:acetate/propionate family kinase [Gaiellaceae bacterium]